MHFQFVDYDVENYDPSEPVPEFAGVNFFTKKKDGWTLNDTYHTLPSFSLAAYPQQPEKIKMSAKRTVYKFPGLG